jgi:cytochrome c peroxidase
MRVRSILLLAALLALAAFVRLTPSRSDAAAYTPRKAVPATPLRVAFEEGLDSLAVALDSLGAVSGSGDHARLASSFREARGRYKRVEGLLEYFAPSVAGLLNGPLPDGDGDAPPRALGAPAAFQRIASAINGDDALGSASVRSAAIRSDAGSMRQWVATLRGTTQFITVRELDVLDATRLEIARVTTLGLAGVDVDLPDDAAEESAEALDGMRALARVAEVDALGAVPSEAWTAIDVKLRDAAGALRREPDFERLDRLWFITAFSTPAAAAVASARARVATGAPVRRRVWRTDAASVFDRGALDASAFAPEYTPSSTPELVALGRRLFFDPRLSGPATRSCASCHDPDRAFTDGQPRAATLGAAGRATARNTPTLLNAAFQPMLFADERAGSLEEQVGAVLASQTEMASSAQLAAERLRDDPSYRAEFGRALPGRSDSMVTGLSVRVALAAYVRSLTALDSRFDRAARGDTAALSAAERAGFTVFMGKGRCGTCHFAPLFNGTVPPEFATSEPEIIGVPVRGRTVVDADVGRAGVDQMEQHRFAFRVPTLRNVARTAPYMHNGAFATLEQVVDFYDRGGGAGLRKPLPALTLSAQPLHLTRGERSELVAFLRALTDTVVAQSADRSVAAQRR